ncbi:EamA family transporter [Plantibacter flavus]
MLGTATSNQLGAAIGSLAFPVIGPAGVVAMRQWVAALVLLPIVRPPVRSYTWRQWWPMLLLAVTFGTMNLSLYTAVERIGLGLAVTLEFLGPLTLALVATRSKLGAGCAVVVAGGVVLLADPQPSTDWFGITCGLVAAASWAGYILLNRTVGARVPGMQGTAVALACSALMFLPVGIVVFIGRPPTIEVVLLGLGAGVLASAIPYVADLITLRRIPTHLFGVLTSVHPLMAGVVGLVVLGQQLAWNEWLGMGVIVSANAVVVGVAGRTARISRRAALLVGT